MNPQNPTRSSSSTRRRFIKRSSIAGGMMFLPGRILGKDGGQSPNNKLNIAAVGSAGKGAVDIAGVSTENIVALCDVDENYAAGTFKKFPKAKRFADFRKMLDAMDKEIDAVTVSTSDHMHFPIAMAAMALGKHVFVQKPVTHTVKEARLIAEAARKQKVMTQMGNQGRAMEGCRKMKEWIDAGAIGRVKELHYWTNRPIWPQGKGVPRPVKDIPKGMHWDLWLGVAPDRPYSDVYAPFKWRGWWDFGCGAIGDIACHTMDAAFFSLDLGAPASVASESSEFDDQTAPKESTIVYEFAAKAERPALKATWFDGGRMPPIPGALRGRRISKEWGQMVIGTEGVFYTSDYHAGNLRIYPEERMNDFMASKKWKKSVPRIPDNNHYQEWIRSIKGTGPKPGSNFDYAGPLTEMALLGNVATRAKTKIEWDPQAMKITNDKAANQWLSKEYRKGWEPVKI